MRPWWKFEKRFGGAFMMRVPGGNGFAYTKGRKTLLIPDEEGELALDLMKKSLQEEKDILEEHYKDSVFKPEKGVLY
jgi:hypothetical protein